METKIFIAQLLPLLLFYLFFAAPQELLLFSLTPLGRFVAIAIIVFYASIHTLYGIVVCIAIILYYQTDMIEGMTTIVPGTSCGCPRVVVFTAGDVQDQDRAHSHCNQSIYTPSGVTRPDQKRKSADEGWDIFDWISPSPNEEAADLALHHDVDGANVADDAGNIYESFVTSMATTAPTPSTMTQKLAAQEELVFPKQTDDWIYRTWQTWFSDDHTRPYPTANTMTMSASLI